MKSAFCKMSLTICRRFCLSEGKISRKVGRADCRSNFSNTLQGAQSYRIFYNSALPECFSYDVGSKDALRIVPYFVSSYSLRSVLNVCHWHTAPHNPGIISIADFFSRYKMSVYFRSSSFPEMPGSVMAAGFKISSSSSFFKSPSFRIRSLTDSPDWMAFFAISAAF